MKSPITTHILDTSRGAPAAGVPITLEVKRDGEFVELSRGVTNDDGRITDLLPPDSVEAAIYRMTFDTGSYFAQAGTAGFYPYVHVVFEITAPNEHHHVPLLLNPFGYATYRGS